MNPREDDINANMVKFAPELASKYSHYPLRRGGSWLDVTEKGPEKEPCFIPAKQEDAGIKEHYVFGPGPKGFGYYHLLTRASYAALYARMTQESPIPCCCWFWYSSERRKLFVEYDEVERIVYARSRAKEPVDASCLSPSSVSK